MAINMVQTAKAKLGNLRDAPPKQVRDALLSDVQKHAKGVLAQDDVTLLTLSVA